MELDGPKNPSIFRRAGIITTEVIGEITRQPSGLSFDYTQHLRGNVGLGKSKEADFNIHFEKWLFRIFKLGQVILGGYGIYDGGARFITSYPATEVRDVVEGALGVGLAIYASSSWVRNELTYKLGDRLLRTHLRYYKS